MASQVERVFYGSNQVPGQQLSREDIKQLRFRIKRDDGTIDNVVFDPLVGQDLYMACLKFFKNYSHGGTPTEVGHYEVGEAGPNGNDFDVEINNQEIFLFREDDLVLTDAEFDRLNADLFGWTPVALRSMSSDNVQHQWLYLSRSPDTGIRFICIEDTKARIAVIAPDSPHNIAISDAFDTSLFELKSNKTSYIDPTIDQSGNYLGGSAVNGFVEKRTFAISVPYNVSNNNTFTKILEYNEIYSSSTSRGALFTRLKIQFVDTYLGHRLPEVDAYIGYDLYNKKAFVTFGNCYKTVYESDYNFKNLHVVTYDDSTRCHIEVYLEHKKLTSMRQWISVEVCENFQITESSYRTYSDHSNWKIPLTNYSWDGVNGASIQPTAAALPTTGVLKTDSYIIQSGNQVPFTYMPFGTGGHEMAIAKLVGNSSYTKLVFKLYCKREGWVAIGKVERVNDEFKLSFSAIADNADFEAGVAVPYIYLSLLDGVYFVNLNIDSYRTVLESIAIEVENVKKDWEFFGSIPPDSVGTTVSGTDTYMKADPTAEVIDQGTNVPAPTSSTKVLTKQTDANGREFWKTEQMSDIPIERLTVQQIRSSAIDLNGLKGGTTVEVYNWSAGQAANITNKPFADASTLVVYPQVGGDGNARQVCYRRGAPTVATREYIDSNQGWTTWREMLYNDGAQVGSASQPVYADANGQVRPCTTGIYEFVSSTASIGWFKLADITFTDTRHSYMGVQIALSWRHVNGVSGSGILAISFAENADSTIVGRIIVTNCRVGMTAAYTGKLKFAARRNSATSFTLIVYAETYQNISYSLISGSPSSFVVPSSTTTDSGTADKIFNYEILTTTTVTPS